jgi:serralysin
VVASLSMPSMNTGEAAGDTYIGIEGLIGSPHSDHLHGDSQNNIIYGYGQDDVLSGGAGSDTLYGGAGWDFLSGGADGDILYGGLGRDHFYFNRADGSTDHIADFATAGLDHDVIDLRGNNLTYADLSIANYLRGALVTIDPYQAVYVQGVAAADLTPDMFLFDTFMF